MVHDAWVDIGAQYGGRVLWLTLLAVVALGSTARAQMVSGERMGDFETVFGVKTRQRAYAFDAAVVDCSAPARILHPGEQATFTVQLINNTDAPIKGRFTVLLVPYGTEGIPGDIWKPVVYAAGDGAALPIDVDLPAKGAHQDFVLTPDTPANLGAYALVADLGEHGRRWIVGYIRTFAPAFKPARLPQLCLDVEDPETLTRLGAAPNRMGVEFRAAAAPDTAAYREHVAARLREYKAAGLPITVEFGAGAAVGPTQPLGRIRPHLDDDGVMLETKSDYAWLPEYDLEFADYVRDLCAEFGWPNGPVNGVMLWNEPWEGISIAGWGADMPRYRAMYRAMAMGVEAARRDAAVQVLIGGCDSDSNTFDKLFGDGSDEFLPWFDFVSIHYQGMNPPALVKAWRERHHPNGRVLVWDTESWVANTDDRVATVVATNLATGHDRAVGIYHGNIVSFHERPRVDADGRRKKYRHQDTWSVAAAIGAANHFIGPRPFRELLFTNGLPWAMRFDAVPTASAPEMPDAARAESGTLVIVGDIGEAFGADYLLYRTARGANELAAKKELAERLARHVADATPESARAFATDLDAWNKRMPLVGGTMRVEDPERRFRLYDPYGNAVDPVDGAYEVPLDHRGFYLTGDGRDGSFAQLVDAVRVAKTTGVEPLAKEALDFLAPLSKKPVLRLRLTNVLNRPVAGALRVAVAGVAFEASEMRVEFAAHETKEVTFNVVDGREASDNAYPLAMRFDAGDDGVSEHFEIMRVNYIARARQPIAINGDLDEAAWKGVVPQPVTAGGGGPTLTELAWEPYRTFDASVSRGYGVGYLAYDDDYLYFAAKIADTTPHPGTLRLETRDDDDFYYPAIARELDKERSRARRVVNRDHAVTQKHGLRARDGAGRVTQAWEAVSRYWSMDFAVPAGEARRVAFYLLDTDTHEVPRRLAPFTFTDTATGRALDTRTFDRYGNGLYAVYEIAGAVTLTVDFGRDWLKTNVFGVFVDAAEPAADGPVARFVALDDETGGDWAGKFGALGAWLCGEPDPEGGVLGGLRLDVPHRLEYIEHAWPEHARRYTYRKRPILPCGNAPSFDNVQLAFNALPADAKRLLSHLPGTMPKFIGYADTDYEYALNVVADAHGGGTEVLRLRYPGMANKHYYPRQGRSPHDGPARGAKLAVKHEDGVRRVECALPWAEIPAVKALMDAGQPVKFSFRINDDQGGGGCMELSRARSVAKRNASFKADWVEHWANELEFGWEPREPAQ